MDGARTLECNCDQCDYGDDVASSLVQHMTELDQAIADFALALDLDTHHRLMQLQVDFKSNADRELLENLKPVTDAAFRSYARKSETGCLDGTRTVVLKQIEDWFEKERSPLFWLNGVAGCGKSTIAQTISERFEKRKLLGASFFFARNQAGRSSVEFLFRTIAYQMASTFPLRDKVLKALEDRAVLTSNPDYQFKQLIVEPISAIRDTLKSPILFVLDGMDECDDEEEEKAVSEVIELFASALGGTSLPLKIFLTSRPEAHIRSRFFDPDIKSNAGLFILHEMRLVDVERDITKYVQSELGKISKLHQSVLRRGPAWPKDTDVADLTTMAAGLFIVASTALKFIGPKPGKGDPRQLLQLILQAQNGVSLASSSTKFVHLDRMYSDILKHATIGEQDFGQFRTIIAAVVLGFEHLSSRALGSLLQLEHRIYFTLEELYSIFLIPEGDALVRPFHASFHDYVTDKDRCRDLRFFIDPPGYHAHLARLCLVRLQTSLTKRDICEIGNRSLLNKEVGDLDIKIKEFLPMDLQYAIRHWAAHLAACSLSESLVDLVRSFALTNLLYWMEALSLLGELGAGLKTLRDASQVVSNSGSPPEDLVTMLHDAERFLFDNFDIISISALHLYYSALPFTPKDSALYHIYEHACCDAPTVIGGIRNTWSACLRTLLHPTAVNAVAISRDGTRIVSGSSDATVHIWDAKTGETLHELEGHSFGVYAIAISQDGTRIVSGSSDKTVRIWDAKTGEMVHKLKGHSHGVNAVAISQDGTRIVSGSSDATVRIWDAETGEMVHELKGHSRGVAVNAVAITQDGTRIVSGSSDATVHIWDAKTGETLHELEGHSFGVYAIAISQDGTRIVSGSSDKTVRIWDAKTGEMVHKLKGHSHGVNAVAISQDGTRIVSGSSDATVRIWDAETGEMVHELKGHSRGVAVNAVAITQDGTRIVSGSSDATVHIWDAKTGETLHELEGHSFGVYAIAISQDGTRIVSGSSDKTVRIWDAKTGEMVHKLEGHSNAVHAVAISQDGHIVSSESFDNMVRIWDAKTGELVHELEGHSSPVNAVAISQDGTRIVSGSSDETVRIWDAKTGEMVHELEGHSSLVNAVAISQDGTRIVSGSSDETVRIWDANLTGETVHELTGHSSDVHAVAISQDGTHIISGSFDKTVHIWDAKTGEMVHKLEGHSHAVDAVAISQDATRIVSGSRDRTVCIWDAKTGEMVHELKGHSDNVKAVAMSQDGTCIASCSFDQTVRIWDAKTGEMVHKLEGHSHAVDAVAISQDATRIVSGSRDRTVRIWDAKTGKMVHQLKGYSSGVNAVAISQDGTRIVSGSSDATVCIWDAKTGEMVHELKGHSDSVNAVAISQDGTRIVSHSDLDTCIWDIQTACLVKSTSTGDFTLSELESLQHGQAQYALKGRWIVDMTRCTRVCYVPGSYHISKTLFSPHVIVLGCHSGEVLFLCFNEKK